MNKKLLIGIIVVVVVFVIVVATLRNSNILALWILFCIPLGIWIQLAWMVRKKKTELAERQLKRLKKFLLVAGISLTLFIVGIFVHNALSGMYDKEEPISFFIGLVALWVYIIATIGGLVIFLKGRRKKT